MLSFFIGIQYVGILILMVEILYVHHQKPSRLKSVLLTAVIAILVNFVGYLFELQASDKAMALQAVKFIYLGKPYITLCTFIFVMKYYNVKIPGWLTCVLCVIHIGVSILVLTCENHTLFYSSIDYVSEGVYPHLVLGHSVLYIAYTCLISLYLLLILVLGIRNFITARAAVQRKRVLYICAIAAVSIAGMMIYFSGITKGYDSTLISYLVSNIFSLILLTRYNLLDTVTLAKDNVVDNSQNGFVVINDSGEVIYYNAQAALLYENLGKNGRDEHKAVMLLEQLYNAKEKYFCGEKVYEIDKKEISKDEIVYGYVYTVSDITESYRYTIELERQKTIAEHASNAKSDFLARMSHEIRTPINSILGMNEMILRESGEPAVKKYAADIKSSANFLLGIINDILDSSKIEAGKIEIIPAKYGLDSLLNDVFNMIYVKAKEKGLELEMQVDEQLPNSLVGDDVRIRQVLFNLLTNSVKYTPTGRVSLSVTGEIQGSFVLMHYRITDTGVGIKQEDMPKLFGVFERIDEDKHRNISGSGLGMSIVVSILELMGSRIAVESEYGKGSSFSFDLKQEIAGDAKIGDFGRRIADMGKDYEYHAAFIAPSARILVVDDNDINRRVFKGLLKQTEVQITDVASGFACLELVQREHFDIIFMDHMMPEMDGIETFEKMKHLAGNQCSDTPTVILTANAVAGAKEKYLSCGFDAFLSKPIVPEKLEMLVKSLLPPKLVKEEHGSGSAQDLTAAGSEQEKLPPIDEFDWAYAELYLPDRELLLHTLKDFHASLDMEYGAVDRAANAVKKDGGYGAIEAYRVRVHALKSTAAAVGALLVSKLARALELAAIHNRTDIIEAVTPVLLEELTNTKIRLDSVFAVTANKNIGDRDRPVIEGLLERLCAALEEEDYDVADKAIEDLSLYRYEQEDKTVFEALKSLVMNLETEKAIEAAKRLQECLAAVPSEG